ncbi:MAG: Holliday junction resolvase RecU [Shouchella clausii]|jgi:recombination protein U|uniref:Holliday junction resolvase RecU n=1 Tax=Shouchella TaxID=2893057 RepID=UPI0007896782|nr:MULTISPECIES: Holliday junction resolvase RecU [Shouchella]PAF14260.1 Holliday junction resolvase RecU [Shouchella clausii]GIN10996.1 Holliday junction resolvase RecU [Shouchella clausii]
MPIRYPNGQPYSRSPQQGQAKKPLPADTYSGRGMTLEQDIDEANLYYLSQQRAVVHKKPTPVQIVKVDYPKRSAAVIREAYFKQASTTDYNGVYRGAYIDFEAKETKNKTSFPLKNIHPHQVDHMREVSKHGGICFVLIRFFQSAEVFLLDAKHLIDYYDNQDVRKSIKKTEIERLGHQVKTGLHPPIDYLRTLDAVYFNGDAKERT